VIVFVAWPTCNVYRSNQTAKAWKAAGYKVAVATDLPSHAIKNLDASVIPMLIQRYEGYWKAMNALCHGLVRNFKADIVICASDGIHPHQGIHGHALGQIFAAKFPNGYGVMQPVGDRWEPSVTATGGQQAWSQNRMHGTRPSDMRCESPWLGRKLIEEVGEYGPFCAEYDQYFADHELHDVAQRRGVLFKNPMLAQYSEHWAAGRRPVSNYQLKAFERSYEKDLSKFKARQYQDFPEPQVKTDIPEERAGGLIMP
jgi:hypothetical protein